MLHVNPYRNFVDAAGVPNVPVHPVMMQAVHAMSVRDPACVTCLELLRSSIATDALSTTKPHGDAPTLVEYLLREHWASFARDVLTNLIVFGFSPVYFRDTALDGRMDETWKKKNAKRIEEGGDTNVMCSVPVVPPFGTWSAYVSRPTPIEAKLLCFPTAALGIKKPLSVHDMNPMAPPPAPTDGDDGLPVMHTLVYTNDTLPHLFSGELQSLMASLLPSFRFSRRMDEFAMQAAFVRANPTVVLQHTEKEFKLEDATVEREFAGTDIGNLPVQQTYRVQTDAAERVRVSQEAYAQRRTSSTTPTSASADPGLRHPIEDSVYTLPPQLVLGPQPAPSAEPEKYDFKVTQHVQNVCAAFGVPVSMVQPALSRGTRDLAEFDQTVFTRSVTAMEKVLRRRLEEVFAFSMNLPQMEELSMGVHSHASIAELTHLFSAEAISLEEFHRQLLRVTGLDMRASKRDYSAAAHERVRDRFAPPPPKKQKDGGGV